MWGMKRLPFLLPALGIAAGHAANPVFTDTFTADPAPIVDGDTCYVITTQDENDGTPGQWLIMNNWRAYSSKDMKTWKSHGVVMDWKTYAWGASDSWASQVVKGADGKFYHYTTLVGRGDLGYGCRCTGVAVSDTPVGPWRDAIGKPLVKDSDTPSPYGWDDIDPTVFIDDDGTPWMAWGNPVCYHARLKKNMTEIDGEIRTMPLPNYTEGPWLFKRDGLYYLIYVSHNHLGYGEKVSYATATSIDGEWTYRGLLCENPGFDSYGIHPGVCEFKGRWYFFYFNDRLQLPNGLHGNSNRRSVCADYMYFNPDGTIRPIVMTKEGLEAEPKASWPARSSNPPAAYPGATSTWKSFDDMRNLTWNPGEIAFATGTRLYYDFPEYRTHRQSAGCGRISQSFRLGRDVRLDRLALFVGNGDGTDKGETLAVELVDEASGKVLERFTFDYQPVFRAPLEFKSVAKPVLKAGTTYRVDLVARRGTSPIVWFVSRDRDNPTHGLAVYE